MMTDHHSIEPAQQFADELFGCFLCPTARLQSVVSSLRNAFNEGYVTASELLGIYAFCVIAASLDKDLNKGLMQIHTGCEIPADFEPFPEGIGQIDNGRFSSLRPRELFSSPPIQILSAVTDSVVAYLVRQLQAPKKRLKGLQAIAFQHPVDRALRSTIDGIPTVKQIFSKFVEDRRKEEELDLWGRAVSVGNGLSPVLECFTEACEILDVTPIPRLFIEQGPLGAYAAGVEEPYVVITSTALSLLNRDELLFVFGHELGHIKAGHLTNHAVAKTARDMAVTTSQFTLGIPNIVADTTLNPLLAAWSRRAELTADRAGYLACQDKETALRALLKLAGFPHSLYSILHSRAGVEQADVLRNMLATSIFNRLYHVKHLWVAQDPFPILRAYELIDWLQDGASDILQMSEEELALAQGWTMEDPVLAEFVLGVIRTIGEWASNRYDVRRGLARTIIRRMVQSHKSPRGTPLEPILQIHASMEKLDANSVCYQIILLVNESGKAARIRVAVDRSDSWDDVPKQYREEFIRSGRRSLDYELYTV